MDVMLIGKCSNNARSWSGLMGIEALYSTYTGQDERDMLRLASKYDLLLSGGSDFHGANKPKLDLGVGYGRLFVPEEFLDNIKKRISANRAGEARD